MYVTLDFLSRKSHTQPGTGVASPGKHDTLWWHWGRGSRSVLCPGRKYCPQQFLGIQHCVFLHSVSYFRLKVEVLSIGFLILAGTHLVILKYLDKQIANSKWTDHFGCGQLEDRHWLVRKYCEESPGPRVSGLGKGESIQRKHDNWQVSEVMFQICSLLPPLLEHGVWTW